MGHRLTQRILECDVCGKVEEDGEYMWEMGTEVWCKDCCDRVDETPNDKE